MFEKTTDTESFESCRESPNQSAAFLNSPNIHQLQRQFVAPNNFLNAYDKENQIVGSHNYANVSQPQWQVGAPFDIPNVNQTQWQVGATYNIAHAFERQNQTVVSYNYANVRQPQWQVGATYNIAHAIERQDQIGVHCNNSTVHQPLGQIAASGNCPNVPEPQSNSADCPKFFDRENLPNLKELYGPVFDDCDEVRRKIREYRSPIHPNASMFARAINVHRERLYSFLRLKGFDNGATYELYPFAYYFFEMRRLDRQEEKSVHRLQSEKNFPGEKTTDTESFESCRESPNQSAAFLNSPNIHQLQRQFVAPNNFLNAYDKENQIVGSHNYANVSQPQWQVGAPFDIPNVNQTQWQVGATYNIAHAIERQEQIGVHCNNPTVHQPLGQIAASGNCPNVPEPQSNSADCPKFFDRQRLRHLRQLYGPVFEDCDDVRRKIREYHSCICRNALEFARAINVPLESLGDFLDLRRQGFDDGADSIFIGIVCGKEYVRGLFKILLSISDVIEKRLFANRFDEYLCSCPPPNGHVWWCLKPASRKKWI
ncbi:hypothetical protein Bhyg_12778 [Pseudolycoriella hygida]|uniref:DUF7726 domain-containing protein n=1 Tax=Pseudolycoriella hygida TaxID=35572 RepID=A0A9Q0MZH6_9DIPT|nr:hypothetical protein Bhyg_12778 [Pseudolycoriella hygida]